MESKASFKDQRLDEVDFSGAVLHGCRFDGTRITDGYPVDLDIDGAIVKVVVNDVDVTQYVRSELERRFPERVRARTWTTASEYRQLLADVAELWEGTIARATAISAEAPYEPVRGEWSMAETIRHLVFATDAWFGRAVLQLEEPYHPLGLVPSGFDPGEPAFAAMDFDAEPRLADVLTAWRNLLARLDRHLATLDDADLAADDTLAPYPGGQPGHTVKQCLGVVIDEAIEHRRYTERHLTLLEAGG